eukprot:2602205-Karenia_brevis.AAC.1
MMPGDEFANYPVILRSTHDNKMYIDPTIENEIELLMQQTRDEYSSDAYQSAYDVLSHDPHRDEKIRDRGVRTKKWPYEEIDGKR